MATRPDRAITRSPYAVAAESRGAGMTAIEQAGKALRLLEEADRLRAGAVALLDPRYARRGRRGPTDALSLICGGGEIPRFSELPHFKARRAQALKTAAQQADVIARNGAAGERP